MTRRGVGGILSWMQRHPEVRPSVDVFLARPSAREVMAGRPALQLIPGRAISLLMDQAKLHSLASTCSSGTRFRRPSPNPKRPR